MKKTSIEKCPERALILCCARTRIDAKTAEQMRNLLHKDIDWAYLIKTAGQHGVIPLVYQSLNTICPEAVPSAYLTQLREHFLFNAQHALILTGELLKLLSLFEAHAIPAIPYKGPVLGELVYGDTALRPFTDLDIIVHKHDVLVVKDLLISQGYLPKLQLTRTQESIHLQNQHHYSLMCPDDRGMVELHWAFAKKRYSYSLKLDSLWAYQKVVSFAGTKVPCFAPEDLLLLLCIHGAGHSLIRLLWICDIAELIRVHREMDWERVIKFARRVGSERVLFLGLLLAAELLETPLPEAILQRMHTDRVVKSLVAQVRDRLFCEEKDLPGVFERFLFHLKKRERHRDKVSFFLRSVMTPDAGEWMRLLVPEFVSFLRYLLRPTRMIFKYGRNLLEIGHLRRPPMS